MSLGTQWHKHQRQWLKMKKNGIQQLLGKSRNTLYLPSRASPCNQGWILRCVHVNWVPAVLLHFLCPFQALPLIGSGWDLRFVYKNGNRVLAYKQQVISLQGCYVVLSKFKGQTKVWADNQNKYTLTGCFGCIFGHRCYMAHYGQILRRRAALSDMDAALHLKPKTYYGVQDLTPITQPSFRTIWPECPVQRLNPSLQTIWQKCAMHHLHPMT